MKMATSRIHKGFGFKFKCFLAKARKINIQREITFYISKVISIVAIHTPYRLDNLLPFFQPIVCSADHRVVGLEILARVRDKKHMSAHFPSYLINENTSLDIYTKIMNKLLKKTLLLISTERLDTLRGCYINVNISPLQIKHKDTYRILEFYAEEFYNNGYKLNVEITEDHKCTDYEDLNEFISSLLSVGVDVYLDDYGKGYSSPLLFKNIILSGIKIDRGFICDLETSEISKKFIQHTVELAREKGMKVIVEGVETRGQHRVASELGVDYMQGFFYGKPAPLHVINEHYSRRL